MRRSIHDTSSGVGGWGYQADGGNGTPRPGLSVLLQTRLTETEPVALGELNQGNTDSGQGCDTLVRAGSKSGLPTPTGLRGTTVVDSTSETTHRRQIPLRVGTRTWLARNGTGNHRGDRRPWVSTPTEFRVQLVPGTSGWRRTTGVRDHPSRHWTYHEGTVQRCTSARPNLPDAPCPGPHRLTRTRPDTPRAPDTTRGDNDEDEGEGDRTATVSFTTKPWRVGERNRRGRHPDRTSTSHSETRTLVRQTFVPEGGAVPQRRREEPMLPTKVRGRENLDSGQPASRRTGTDGPPCPHRRPPVIPPVSANGRVGGP